MKKYLILLGLFGGFAHGQTMPNCTTQFVDGTVKTEQCDQYRVGQTSNGYYYFAVSSDTHLVAMFSKSDFKTDKPETIDVIKTMSIDSISKKTTNLENTSGQCYIDSYIIHCSAGDYKINGQFKHS